MKRTLALVLSLCLLCGLFVPVQAAKVDDPDDMLACLKTLEIMVGDGAGNLNLEAPVTRAAFAKLLIASSVHKDALGGQGAGYSLFTDVKSGHWASEYIKLCLDNGWMIGYTDGSFRPDNTVTLEEACTATLRLLGFDSSNLSGSFPTAQLNKASAVGLRDGLDAQRGQALTRADCARLFYNLLTCKNAQNQVYALTLGNTLDSDGKVDYMAVVKEDLEGPYVCSGSAPALSFTPDVTYFNDKVVDHVSWQSDDVYYYAYGYLWVYRNPVYGQISALAPSTSNPETVSIGNKSYKLGSDAVKDQLSALGSNAVGASVTLLLGMDGEVAAAHTVEGPFVADSSTVLGFTPQTIYRDGQPSESAKLTLFDVYYYSVDSRTLWIYTDRVSGKIQALSPSRMNPTAVTISGQSYTLATDELSRRLSSLNGKWTDKFVTLLFGMDGTVVEVLTDEAVEATYYGVVQSAAKGVVDGVLEQQVSILCTDGRTHVFSTDTTREWETGDMAQIAVDQNGAELTLLKRRSLSGTVDAAAGQVGDYPLAANIQVLDLDEDGNGAGVSLADLDALTLTSSNVRYYALNGAGQVEHLILENATEVVWSYGFLAELEHRSSGSMSFTNQYTILMDGQSRTYSVSNKSYPVQQGQGVAVRLSAGGTISGMQRLTAVTLTGLNQTTAIGSDGKTYALADYVSTCLGSKDQGYYPAALKDLNTTSYTLTGYYDAARQKIRVVLARTQ